MTLTFDGAELPDRGSEVRDLEGTVGTVTSAVITPGYGPLSLAVVSTERSGEGTRLSAGGRPATVRPLPIYDPDRQRPRG